MAAISVAYTVNKVSKLEDGRKMVHAKLVFGDGVKTYAATGVPIDKASLGCPTAIDSLAVEGARSSGFMFGYDPSQPSIRMFENGAAANSNPLSEVAAGATPAAQTVDVVVVGY